VQSSRKAFDERLNWDLWGATMREKLTGLLDHNLVGTAGVSS
jgi:hypothetical protein